MNKNKKVYEKKIVPTEKLLVYVKTCINTYKSDIIIMGRGTWSKKIRPIIKSNLRNIPLLMVNEKHSTEKGKLRYYKDNPPKGFWKLIPVTMQVPKEPYDDYAAIIIAENYIDCFNSQKNSSISKKNSRE